MKILCYLTLLFATTQAFADFPPGAYRHPIVCDEGDDYDCDYNDDCCDCSGGLIDTDGYWYEQEDTSSWPGAHEDSWYDQLTN